MHWVRQHYTAAAREEQQVSNSEQTASCIAGEECYESDAWPGRQWGLMALRSAILQTPLYRRQRMYCLIFIEHTDSRFEFIVIIIIVLLLLLL